MSRIDFVLHNVLFTKGLAEYSFEAEKNASYMHYIIADFNISELICELVALVDGNVFLQINMRLLKSVWMAYLFSSVIVFFSSYIFWAGTFIS